MKALLQPQMTDPPRRILAVVLLAIALALVAGGAELALLGGSLYYVIAGVAVLVSAWWIWRGDHRGVWLYGAMLVGTLLWALAEGGLDPWRLQSRLVAPLVLGIWVFWNQLRAHRRASLAALAILIAGFGGWLALANGVDSPPAELAQGELAHGDHGFRGIPLAPVFAKQPVAGLDFVAPVERLPAQPDKANHLPARQQLDRQPHQPLRMIDGFNVAGQRLLADGDQIERAMHRVAHDFGIGEQGGQRGEVLGSKGS